MKKEEKLEGRQAMSDHYPGFQMLQKQEAQQRQQQQQTPDNNDNRGNWAYITDFVVDDKALCCAV